MYTREQIPFRCTIMRCGTSKGIFFNENHLPQDRAERDKTILAIFGSPDKRQIDGIGGAEPLTSKVAIIGAPSVIGADVNYTFGQVEIDKAEIHYDGLCGNISSGIGTYAIEEGLVAAVEPITTVRVYSVNTKQIYTIDVPVKDGLPLVHGDYKIDGVPGTGAKLTINMAGTVASRRMGIYPTGNKIDELEIPGHGTYKISIVDVVNPVIFIDSKELGLSGKETGKEISPEIYEIDLAIRTKVAGMLKIENWSNGPVPILVFVAPPEDTVSHLTGEPIPAESIDFLARAFFLGGVHQTFPGSVSCVTGAAARLSGTVVNKVSTNSVDGVVRIGHPAGVIEVECEIDVDSEGNEQVNKIAYGRTARRIMDGSVYLPSQRLK